jgi:hypothetical protein
MPTEKKTKSAKLKKYAGVYQKCLREQQKSTKALEKSAKREPKKSPKKLPTKKEPKKSPKRSPKKSPKRSPKKLPKRSPKKLPAKKEPVKSPKKLNSYQLFVKSESKKAKYKGLEARERMNLIGVEWKKQK